MMKRILLLSALTFGASVMSFGQTAALPLQYCVQGATQAATSGIKSSNYQQGVIPYCTVTVYLTGTTTKATIYSDSTNTPLSNPFIADSNGKFLTYAGIGQGYDVTLSGGIPPLTYPSPVTITDLLIGASGGVAGVTNINGTAGSFAFTGAVSCTGASCNFTGAPTFQHNGVNLTDQSLVNFNDTTPAAPSGFQDITFNSDSLGDLSAYIPSFYGGIEMSITPPVTGQYTILSPATCSIAVGGVPSAGTGQCASNNSGAGIGVEYYSGLVNYQYATATFTFSLPSSISQSSITAVYGAAYSASGGTWGFTNINPLNCAEGTNRVALGPSTANYALQEVTTEFSLVPTINNVQCVMEVGSSNLAPQQGAATIGRIALIIYYTGSGSYTDNNIQVFAPLMYSPGLGLTLSLPYDIVYDTTSTNSYNATLPALNGGAASAGFGVKLIVSNSNTVTAPTLDLNQVTGTIVSNTGTAIAAGDIAAGIPAVLVMGTNGNWRLQNPQSGGGGAVYPPAGIPLSTGTGWGTSYTAQGTDTKLLTSGTVSGTGATLCTDANGGATTSGCTGGSRIANTTFTVGTTAMSANTCTTASTVTMTGVLTSSAFFISPSTDVSAVTGWGSTGGLVIDAWPTANTLNYKVCNQTASSITPSASVTFNVGAR